jgi:hypothetical protein
LLVSGKKDTMEKQNPKNKFCDLLEL